MIFVPTVFNLFTLLLRSPKQADTSLSRQSLVQQKRSMPPPRMVGGVGTTNNTLASNIQPEWMVCSEAWFWVFVWWEGCLLQPPFPIDIWPPKAATSVWTTFPFVFCGQWDLALGLSFSSQKVMIEARRCSPIAQPWCERVQWLSCFPSEHVPQAGHTSGQCVEEWMRYGGLIVCCLLCHWSQKSVIEVAPYFFPNNFSNVIFLMFVPVVSRMSDSGGKRQLQSCCKTSSPHSFHYSNNGRHGHPDASDVVPERYVSWLIASKYLLGTCKNARVHMCVCVCIIQRSIFFSPAIIFLPCCDFVSFPSALETLANSKINPSIFFGCFLKCCVRFGQASR